MESLWPGTNGELLSGGKRLLDSSEVKVPGELSDIYFNLDFSYLFNHPGGSLLLSFGYNSLLKKKRWHGVGGSNILNDKGLK